MGVSLSYGVIKSEFMVVMEVVVSSRWPGLWSNRSVSSGNQMANSELARLRAPLLNSLLDPRTVLGKYIE